MKTTFYPALVHPADDQGLVGVEIPGINVNGCGGSVADALANATAILQEVIDDLSAAGEPVSPPERAEDIIAGGVAVAMIPAFAPAKTVRVNVTLPDNIVARIDAVAPNRSAFLAESALARLRSM